jgi:gluconokinase
VLTCVLVAWGAWQQVVVGMDSKSVVLGYPSALLPLPAFLCSVAIGVMAFVNFIRGSAIAFDHSAEVE